ncbi:MAG: dTDP-glucose 4,6-dehydratase [Patescibacteria group bacterium]
MSENVKKVLVCGGCGFMGSQFIRHLHNKYPNYQIYNLDLLTYAGNPENLKDLAVSDRYHFVHGDIGDKPLIEDLMAKHKFDVVINFAAESHVDRSILNAFQFIKTNIQGAYVLLEAARHYKIPRFVYVSTDEIYGDVPHGVKTDENYPLQPTNPYAASKAAADLMVQAYIKTHRVPAVVLRSSNNYGPYQYPEKLHSLVITNLLEGRKVPVHGKGLHLRSWIHTQDFCNALDLVMHKGDDYKTYNVAGEERSNMEVIRAVAKTIGKNHDEHIEHVSDRPGADFRYAPDHSRISKELKWERQYSYDDALREIVAWYDNNRDWWQKIKLRGEFQDHYQKQSKGQYDL